MTRTRSRATAKTNGTRFETAMERYLQWALDDPRIQRLRLHGAKDIGDIGNVFYRTEPVTIECKWTGTLNAAGHMREAMVEAANADGRHPWVLQKRDGTGLATLRSCGEQLAYTYDDVLADMISGETGATVRMVTDGMRVTGRARDIDVITVRQFALLLNHGLPLGPDTEATR